MKHLLTYLYSMAIAIAALPLPWLHVLLRPMLAASVLPAIGRVHQRLTRTELTWAALNVVVLSGTLVSVVVAIDKWTAIEDMIRQAFLLGIGVLLPLTMRQRSARKNFSAGFIVPTLVLAAVLLIVYLYTAGLQGFPRSLKQTNYDIFLTYGIAFNPLSFAFVLTLILSFPSWKSTPRLAPFLIVISAFVIILAGSRTTYLSIAVATFLALVWRMAAEIPPLLRAAVGVVVLPATLIGVWYGSLALITSVGPFAMNQLTAGRWALWAAGLSKFYERPFAGWGGGSWHIQLESHLPPYDIYSNEAILTLKSGAFHNTYITLLAEKGLIVAVPALVLMVYLFHLSVRVWKTRGTLSDHDRAFATIAPAVMLLLALRSAFEQPGLFGHASGLVDFCAYAWAGMLIAVSSSLELPE